MTQPQTDREIAEKVYENLTHLLYNKESDIKLITEALSTLRTSYDERIKRFDERMVTPNEREKMEAVQEFINHHHNPIVKQLNEKIQELEQQLKQRDEQIYKMKCFKEHMTDVAIQSLDDENKRFKAEISDLKRRMDVAIRLFEMIHDRPFMKADDYYAKYPEYRNKIMNDGLPYSGELQISKYALATIQEKPVGKLTIQPTDKSHFIVEEIQEKHE